MNKSFSLSYHQHSIAVITIDVQGESVNTLRAEFAQEFEQMLAEIKADPQIKGVVIISAKQDSFIAGADISMLDRCASIADAERLSRQGHEVFMALESLNIPVVAAIHGACLGGGFELALACHARICTDSDKTLFGLPEVQLGLLPGGGGTQRLPRLIGVTTALKMMLTAKSLRPAQALSNGLISEVVPEAILLDSAINRALLGIKKPPKSKLPLLYRLLESTSVGRNFICDKALKQLHSKTHGHYPAPEKIVDCVRQGMNKGLSIGLDIEATHFASLVMSPQSKSLRGLFFATTAIKKEFPVTGVKPNPVKKVMVLGGGLMGAGIAAVTVSKAKIITRVKDVDQAGLSHALSYVYRLLDKKVKRRYMSAVQRDQLMALMTTTVEYDGMHGVDIVIEAVFEDLALKHQMIKEIEKAGDDKIIFASNTSSLPIAQIAEGAQRPENVIGLHYFSPVDKMPLVEVIAHRQTSAQTIATTLAFARRQGKVAIVVQDGAGFYINRILALYINEAANLLLEGHKIEHIDSALVEFGFPVGPMALLDEVGIDIAAKIAPILEKELGERFKMPAAFDKLLADGRKGRKNGKGFYQYQAKSTKKKVDESVYKVLKVNATTQEKDDKLLAQRCVVQMLNEAVRCLDSEIIASARDGDIGAIFGIGFPAFIGGPFRYIDNLGTQQLVTLLNEYSATYGERFKPCERLVEMGKTGEQFYPD